MAVHSSEFQFFNMLECRALDANGRWRDWNLEGNLWSNRGLVSFQKMYQSAAPSLYNTGCFRDTASW